jgi:dihydrofolate reductase
MTDLPPRLHIVLIAAVAANGVIGVDNTLPWRIADDLKRFKALTLGHAIVMGRKTWESLGRALPGRHNIVVTRNADYQAAGATVVTSIGEALAVAARKTENAASAPDENTLFIIGGAEIYAHTLPLADRLELTEVHANVSGDAFFPAFDPHEWQTLVREPHTTADGLAYDFVTYQRVGKKMSGVAASR